MKKSLYFSVLAAAATLLASCAKEMSMSDSSMQVSCGTLTSFTVSSEDSKAALQDGAAVIFNAGDSIRIQGKAGHVFKTESTGTAVTFSGLLDGDDTTTYCAFYPYGAYSSDEGEGVYNVTVPNYQVGVKDSFDPAAALMVGRTSGSAFAMKNAVALVKFTLTTSDITSVSLCNAAGVKVAGRMSVTVPDDGSAPVLGEGSANNVLLVPSGETFEPGTYYMAVTPAALTGGVQLMFTRTADDAIATKKGAAALTFKRSVIMNLGTVDASLDWTPVTKVKVSFWEDGWSNPFSTSIKTSISSAVCVDTAVVLRTKADNIMVPVYAEEGICGGNYGLRFLGGESSYIKFPVINGLIPAAFRAVAGDAEKYFRVSVCDNEAAEPANGGSFYYALPAKGLSQIWHIVTPDADKAYSVFKVDGTEFRARSWEFIYTGTKQPTVAECTTLAASDVNPTGATLSGSFRSFFNDTASDFTCGFEYKTDGEWTSVQCAQADSAFSYTLSGLAGGVACTFRAWAADAVGKVYGGEMSFTPVAEVVYTLMLNSTEFDRAPSGITAGNSSNSNKLLVLPGLSGNHNTISLYCVQNAANSGVGITEEFIKFYYSAVNSYILLPALNGLSLKKVDVVTASGSTKSGKWGIYDGSAVVSGGSFISYGSTLPSTKSFTLSGTVPGKAYSLCTGVAKNDIRASSVTLTFSGTETATAQFAYAPKYLEGTVSSKMLYNTVTRDSDITSGFEYKAGGSGDFTALAAGVNTALSEGVSTASATASLAAGDVVRSWTSIDGGATKVYSPETTIQ